MGKIINIFILNYVFLMSCFSNDLLKEENAIELNALFEFIQRFDENTDPHVHDQEILNNNWLNRPLVLLQRVIPENKIPDAALVHEQILKAANRFKNPTHHKISHHEYIMTRFHYLHEQEKAYIEGVNNLLHVIGWCANNCLGGDLDIQYESTDDVYESIVSALIPSNDSPSAMYNVLLEQTVHMLQNWQDFKNKDLGNALNLAGLSLNEYSQMSIMEQANLREILLPSKIA